MLPFVQITLAREAEADRILTLSPIDLRDYFTSLTMEHARDQPIAEPTLEKIARVLRIALTEKLRRGIYDTIIGTTLMTVRKWYSPRMLLALLKELKRDSLGTISRSKGDTSSSGQREGVASARKKSAPMEKRTESGLERNAGRNFDP